MLQYEYLVVAAGLQIDWDKIKGLKDTIGRNGVVSIYDYQYSQDTWEALRNLKVRAGLIGEKRQARATDM